MSISIRLNKQVEAWRGHIIKDAQRLLRIKSVEGLAKEGMPFGEGLSEALQCALSIAESMHLKTVNLDNYAGFAEFGQGEDYVAVLGHLDVVPEGDNWIYPPFAAEIHHGKIYARGAVDDKGPLIAALYALKAVKEEDLKLSKRVRIIFGTNEETESKDMHYYLKKEKPPISGFTPDADYPVINGEKGITTFDLVKRVTLKSKDDFSIQHITGGQRPNMVPDYCEALIKAADFNFVNRSAEEYSLKTGFNITALKDGDSITIKSKGVSAHGSIPKEGKNAVMQLFGFLGELPLPKDDITDIILFFNKYVGMETEGQSFGVSLQDEVSGSLSFNVGAAEIDKNKVRISLNLRYPVTATYEEMMVPFMERIGNTGLEIKNMVHNPPLYFPEDHPLVRTLLSVYTEQTGFNGEAQSIGGSTYAKEMPNILAFGPQFPGRPDLAHQSNEYIEIEDLILNCKIYANAIYQLAK